MKERVPKSGWRELLAWRFGRRHAFRMADEAMIPTLPPDAVIFFDPAGGGDSGRWALRSAQRQPPVERQPGLWEYASWTYFGQSDQSVEVVNSYQ